MDAVEFNRTNKIEMSFESEKFHLSLPIVDDDFEIIRATRKEWLCGVESNTSYCTIANLKLGKFHANFVIENMDNTDVRRVKNPWT